MFECIPICSFNVVSFGVFQDSLVSIQILFSKKKQDLKKDIFWKKENLQSYKMVSSRPVISRAICLKVVLFVVVFLDSFVSIPNPLFQKKRFKKDIFWKTKNLQSYDG